MNSIEFVLVFGKGCVRFNGDAVDVWLIFKINLMRRLINSLIRRVGVVLVIGKGRFIVRFVGIGAFIVSDYCGRRDECTGSDKAAHGGLQGLD
jgi:hypothetical protein